MFDLHCHLLPGIDDGASELAVSLDMAREFAAQGVQVVACTPHILPGVYHNTGPQIRGLVAELQERIDDAGIELRLVTGADNHIIPDFVDGLARGHLLALHDTRYVLVEPPHHVAPARLEDLFFNILLARYVPVLTHPERLSWIDSKYDVVTRLAQRGVWMQITAGSLRGAFGRRPKYWAERMLSEGLVQIMCTDAHDLRHRRPDLAEGRALAEKLVGAEEAHHLVATRPEGILMDVGSEILPAPQRVLSDKGLRGADERAETVGTGTVGGLAGRLRTLFR